MPNQFSIDELVEHLVFIEKLESRAEQSKNDETVSEEELECEMRK